MQLIYVGIICYSCTLTAYEDVENELWQFVGDWILFIIETITLIKREFLLKHLLFPFHISGSVSCDFEDSSCGYAYRISVYGLFQWTIMPMPRLFKDGNYPNCGMLF